MSVVERMRLAEDYLDLRAPLAALEALRPVEDELSGVVSGELLLARAYFASAQLGRAEQAFRRVIELDPVNDFAYFALGRTLERQSRPGEALRHFRIAAAMNPCEEYRERLDLVETRSAPTPDGL